MNTQVVSTQSNERELVEKLRLRLDTQPLHSFQLLKELAIPHSQGVYLIRDMRGIVHHVGRTVSGKKGLAQRLDNHYKGKSSFVRIHLKGDCELLIKEFKFQYIPVVDHRERALLEHHAIAWYCPAHLGLSRKTDLPNCLETEYKCENG